MSDRRTQGAMLLAVGGMALFLGRSDVTLSYVRAGIRPLLAASGAVLLVLGLAALFGPARRDGQATPAQPEQDGGRPVHGSPRIAWLLVLPLLVLILVQPPALGAYAAGRRTGPTAAGPRDDTFPPVAQAVRGAVPMELSEFYYRALYDERHSLDGVRVRLLGFVAPRRGGDGYLLARFAMYCCAADAEVVEVAIRGDPTQRAADQWVEVEGHWEASPAAGGAGGADTAPVLVADSVTPVAPPRDRYEHSLYGF